jgi:hypothetical protein
MIVTVSLDGDEAGDDLRRLEQWLRDDDLHGVKVNVVDSAAEPGDMGPVPELIQLLLEPQGVMTAVAASIGTWAGMRRRNVRVRVRSGDKEVEIDASRIEDPEEVASRIARELDK